MKHITNEVIIESTTFILFLFMFSPIGYDSYDSSLLCGKAKSKQSPKSMDKWDVYYTISSHGMCMALAFPHSSHSSFFIHYCWFYGPLGRHSYPNDWPFSTKLLRLLKGILPSISTTFFPWQQDAKIWSGGAVEDWEVVPVPVVPVPECQHAKRIRCGETTWLSICKWPLQGIPGSLESRNADAYHGVVIHGTCWNSSGIWMEYWWTPSGNLSV